MSVLVLTFLDGNIDTLLSLHLDRDGDALLCRDVLQTSIHLSTRQVHSQSQIRSEQFLTSALLYHKARNATEGGLELCLYGIRELA